MSISLNKPASVPVQIPMPNTAPAPIPVPANNLPPEQVLRDMITRRFSVSHGDDYCEADTLAQLLQSGLDFGIDAYSVRNLIEMELERACIVNEKQLLDELGEILQRLAGRDKRLQAKDYQDAMQFVCKARPGFTRGLDLQVATRFALEFCRTQQIAQKAALFQWKVL